MSVLRIRIGTQWVDVCSCDFRLYKTGGWNKVKPGDSVFATGQWRKIICARPYKWVIDPTGTTCETKDIIENVPITLANPQYNQYGIVVGIAVAPGTTFRCRKNNSTGTYDFSLEWIELNNQGVGPGVYHAFFNEAGPPGDSYRIAPIGRMDNPSHYPSSRIELYGVGCYGFPLRGHIDTSGFVWVDAATAKSITAWNPADPRFIMQLYNIDHIADFNGVNVRVNTGISISTLEMKVTDDNLELPLDDNNELTSVSGNPQSKRAVAPGDPNYRTIIPGKCEAPAIGYGNTAIIQDFTRNNCAGGFEGGTISYTLPANTFYGPTLSDANAQAQNAISSLGQAYANVHGACTQQQFGNELRQQAFTRNNCPDHFTGTVVNYVVPPYTFLANTQLEANNLALADIAAHGQAYANSNGNCVQIEFGNTIQSQAFQRNNCGGGQTGSVVTLTVGANSYYAGSVEAANDLALEYISSNGQAYANTNGTCTADPSELWSFEFNSTDIDLTGITGTLSMKRAVSGPGTETLASQSLDPDSANMLTVDIYTKTPVVTSYYIEVSLITNTLDRAIKVYLENSDGDAVGDFTIPAGETGTTVHFLGSEFSEPVLRARCELLNVYYLVTNSFGISFHNPEESCTVSTEPQQFFTINPDGIVGIGDWLYIEVGGEKVIYTRPGEVGGDPAFYWISYDEGPNRIWLKIAYDSGSAPDSGDIVADKGNCVIENVSFTIAQHLRKLRMTGTNITCTVSVNIIYRIAVPGQTEPSPGTGSTAIILGAGSSEADSNTGSITSGPEDTIVIDSFTFTPKYCAGKKVLVNGQEGIDDIEEV